MAPHRAPTRSSRLDHPGLDHAPAGRRDPRAVKDVVAASKLGGLAAHRAPAPPHFGPVVPRTSWELALLAILLLHVLLTVAAVPLARRLGKVALLVCAAGPLAAVVWSATRAPGVIRGESVVETIEWVPGLDLALTVRLDGFALLMVLIVSGVGVAIFGYAARYLSDDDPLPRFTAALTGFAGAMLGVVLADHLLLLYVCWELTSLASYLLIGHKGAEKEQRRAALQALLVTTAGGFVMLGGFVLLGQAAGTYRLSGLVADPPDGTLVAVALGLVLVGIATKSAQVPVHGWLPAAMVAPTPVSAYLHAAAMVKAGVYLAARLAPAFGAVAGWRAAVLVLGSASILVGGWQALRERDLKRLLAYSTISQLGLLMVLLGVGIPEATTAGVTLLLAHALAKSALFMTAGVLDHAAGTRDLEELRGAGRRSPALALTVLAAAASLAGLPPLLGFVAKEEAVSALLDTGGGVGVLALVAVSAGAVLTVGYAVRAVWLPILARGPSSAGPDDTGERRWEAPGPAFLASGAVLGGTGLVLGVVPALVSPLLIAAATSLTPLAPREPLHLWPGLGLPLTMSAFTIAAGLALAAVVARRAQPVLRRLLPAADRVGDAALYGVERLCHRVIGVLQPGSLPVYLTVILATALVIPGTALLRAASPGLPARATDSTLQLVVGLFVVVTAVAVLRARHRFAAVLVLGTLGYAVAALFAVHGAPDLALTQFLVETVTLVAFALVLRRLPSSFTTRRSPRVVAGRGALAGALGLLVAMLALSATQVPNDRPVSEFYLDEAESAGGSNVVSVILSDFRALDTLGEITVVAVATLGVLHLLRARREEDEG